MTLSRYRCEFPSDKTLLTTFHFSFTEFSSLDRVHCSLDIFPLLLTYTLHHPILRQPKGRNIRSNQQSPQPYQATPSQTTPGAFPTHRAISTAASPLAQPTRKYPTAKKKNRPVNQTIRKVQKSRPLHFPRTIASRKKNYHRPTPGEHLLASLIGPRQTSDQAPQFPPPTPQPNPVAELWVCCRSDPRASKGPRLGLEFEIGMEVLAALGMPEPGGERWGGCLGW